MFMRRGTSEGGGRGGQRLRGHDARQPPGPASGCGACTAHLAFVRRPTLHRRLPSHRPGRRVRRGARPAERRRHLRLSPPQRGRGPDRDLVRGGRPCDRHERGLPAPRPRAVPHLVPAGAPRPGPPERSGRGPPRAARRRDKGRAPDRVPRLLLDGRDPGPGTRGPRGPRRQGRGRGREVRRLRRRSQRGPGHPLLRGQRVRPRLRARRPPPPARGDPGAQRPRTTTRRPAQDHVRAPPDPDGAGHPGHLLLRPEGLPPGPGARLSRLLRGAALHAADPAEPGDEARQPHEPLRRQRGRPGREGGRDRGHRQPHQRGIGTGSGMLQHRLRIRPDGGAADAPAVAVNAQPIPGGITADQLDLDADQVLVGTTGVIGRFLPMDAVKEGIQQAATALCEDAGEGPAIAIMTTDTAPKTAALELQLAGHTVKVGGMAKGSGMIHPNMATMLAYVTTDAPDAPEAETLEAAILDVARELARDIARDGEGATKLLTVRVVGAPDDVQARLAARSVASSSLVKTAVHGGDPNWGRIVCALGYSGSELAVDRLTVRVAGLTVFTAGAGQEVDLDQVRAAFEQPEIEIFADLGLGDGEAEAWGCDLSSEYVRINAEYTT